MTHNPIEKPDPQGSALAQHRIETATAQQVQAQLLGLIRLVGNSGISDSETDVELEMALSTALAAASRWVLDTQLHAKEWHGTDFPSTNDQGPSSE